MHVIDIYPVQPRQKGKRQRWNWRLRHGKNVMCRGSERGRKGEGGGFASLRGAISNLHSCMEVFSSQRIVGLGDAFDRLTNSIYAMKSSFYVENAINNYSLIELTDERIRQFGSSVDKAYSYITGSLRVYVVLHHRRPRL